MTKSAISAIIVFCLALVLTFAVAVIGRRHTKEDGGEQELAGRDLNKWLVGLSAGTTGNSGFIVTGAVGLGYTGGLHWILLPISWMIGDFIFWAVFPARLNAFGRQVGAVTLSELLSANLPRNLGRTIALVVSVLIIICLSGYTAGQWLAGKKIISGMVNISDFWATFLFALTVISYSSIGGFRGSVYTDTLQAVIRLFGTGLAVGAIIWCAVGSKPEFIHAISAAGADFLSPFPHGTIAALAGFIGGFACAAIGFGLGQPQIVARYLAGRDPGETRAAWWIYIGFIQITWISMTVFGIMLRGVMPGLLDPEAGLSIFFQQKLGPFLTGIITADIFATIASTSNGILIAIVQSVQRDIVQHTKSKFRPNGTMTTIAAGVLTIILSTMLNGNVYSIIISSISLLGASLGGPVMIKVLGIRHTGKSLLIAILSGLVGAIGWKILGLDASFNEAGVGIFCSVTANYLCQFAAHRKESA